MHMRTGKVSPGFLKVQITSKILLRGVLFLYEVFINHSKITFLVTCWFMCLFSAFIVVSLQYRLAFFSNNFMDKKRKKVYQAISRKIVFKKSKNNQRKNIGRFFPRQTKCGHSHYWLVACRTVSNVHSWRALPRLSG